MTHWLQWRDWKLWDNWKISRLVDRQSNAGKKSLCTCHDLEYCPIINDAMCLNDESGQDAGCISNANDDFETQLWIDYCKLISNQEFVVSEEVQADLWNQYCKELENARTQDGLARAINTVTSLCEQPIVRIESVDECSINNKCEIEKSVFNGGVKMIHIFFGELVSGDNNETLSSI
jgi:hypothetical protein